MSRSNEGKVALAYLLCPLSFNAWLPSTACTRSGWPSTARVRSKKRSMM